MRRARGATEIKMGFGTLFIGYFLLLNVTYFGFTDVIAALLMLLACYKLKSVNVHFKRAEIPLGLFAALGTVELFEGILTMFAPDLENATLTSLLSIIRYAILAAAVYFILSGIIAVSDEVELPCLTARAKLMRVLSILAMLFSLALEMPWLKELDAAKPLWIMGFIALLFNFFTVLATLSVIYTAYMRICMPEDLEFTEKPSRFAFVNKYREREARKQREYAEYKTAQMQKKAKKRKK